MLAIHSIALLQTCGPVEPTFLYFDVDAFQATLNDSGNFRSQTVDSIHNNRVVIEIEPLEKLFIGSKMNANQKGSFFTCAMATSLDPPIEVPNNFITAVSVFAQDAYGDSVAVNDDISNYFLTRTGTLFYENLEDYLEANETAELELISRYRFPTDSLSFRLEIELDDARTFDISTPRYALY